MKTGQILLWHTILSLRQRLDCMKDFCGCHILRKNLLSISTHYTKRLATIEGAQGGAGEKFCTIKTTPMSYRVVLPGGTRPYPKGLLSLLQLIAADN